jgi:hypothetical protein
LVRNKLEALLHSSVYEPGSIALLPYFVGQNGQTVTEALSGGLLPDINPTGYLPAPNGSR